MKSIPASFLVDVNGIEVLVRRKRVKRINFRIGSDGQASMSIPWHVSYEEAKRVAQQHASWFETHKRLVEKRRPETPATWKTGERLQVWGAPKALRIVEDDTQSFCTLCDDELVLHAPANASSASRAQLVERWLASQLKERVQELLPICEQRVGRRASSITLRRMKTRWGSCTPKTARIRLNTALAECPPHCLEMVLIHELCHLVEPSHGQRFHALMDLHCPDWRATQRWLDEHPPRVLD